MIRRGWHRDGMPRHARMPGLAMAVSMVALLAPLTGHGAQEPDRGLVLWYDRPAATLRQASSRASAVAAVVESAVRTCMDGV